MSGLNTLMFALALVLWTQVTVTNSSTTVPLQTTTIATRSSSASATVTGVQTSKTVAATTSVASSTVFLQASENATSSPVTSASDIIQASKSVTSSPVASASHVTNVTSSPVSPAPKSVTSSPVTSPSVTRQASKSITSSASTFAVQVSVSVTIIVNESTSPLLTPGINSSVPFNETSQPSTQVSPNASSFTSSPNTTTSLPSAAVSATTFTSQSVSKFTAAVVGQSSKMAMLSSSVVPSPSVSQFIQVGTSTLAHSEAPVSVMTHLVGSPTVSTSNSSSTSFPTINTTSTALPATSTTVQPTALTLPPGGTKFVSMEVSFDIPFKEEYSDTGSPEYEELKDNLTTSLEKVYQNVDGFVGVRILLITKGSVVCSYVVILAKDSEVKPSELKEKLQQASDEGKLFRVKSVKVEEDDSKETEEKLPKWALVVMIVLGCLSAVFLVTVIYLCVKYRRSLYGSREAYLVSSGEIGLAHTYDRVSIGDNKNGANHGTTQKPAADRRVIGSHTNPTYGSNGALAD